MMTINAITPLMAIPTTNSTQSHKLILISYVPSRVTPLSKAALRYASKKFCEGLSSVPPPRLGGCDSTGPQCEGVRLTQSSSNWLITVGTLGVCIGLAVLLSLPAATRYGPVWVRSMALVGALVVLLMGLGLVNQALARLRGRQ